MSRAEWKRLLYFAPLTAFAAGAAGWWFVAGRPLGAALSAAAILFLPSRIQAYFWKDLFRTRRLIDAGRPDEAKAAADRFLTDLRERPWLKRLVWLGPSAYTPRVEAMGRLNRGVARLAGGDLDGAGKDYQAAREIDPDYPLAYWNLGVLAWMRGDEEHAEELAAEARRLGYSAGTADALVRQAGRFNAAVRGL